MTTPFVLTGLSIRAHDLNMSPRVHWSSRNKIVLFKPRLIGNRGLISRRTCCTPAVRRYFSVSFGSLFVFVTS